MKYDYDKQKLKALLSADKVLSVRDFSSLFTDAPMTTVYARIRELVSNGVITPVGKGRYTAIHKPSFIHEITPEMENVNWFLIDKCEGVDFCLKQVAGNIILATPKYDIKTVMSVLKSDGRKVALKKDADLFPNELNGYILLEPMVSEAPLSDVGGVYVSSLEKDIVDRICNKKETLSPFEFQKIAEVYPLNHNRLLRYASRRGVSEELSSLEQGLNYERMKLFSAVQGFLPSTRITRAWVFGSFARGEETAGSDLDLLVDYDSHSNLSLLTIVRYQLDLEKLIGREVDLIENGHLKPFAVPSAEKDKYLIYER